MVLFPLAPSFNIPLTLVSNNCPIHLPISYLVVSPVSETFNVFS